MSSLESDQKSSKQISEEAITESEMILIQHKKYNTGKNNTKNTTHVQREVEISPPDILMIGKGPNQKFIEFRHIPFNLIGQYHL